LQYSVAIVCDDDDVRVDDDKPIVTSAGLLQSVTTAAQRAANGMRVQGR
jgi:hypothetical protein